MKYTRRPLHAASYLLALALSTSALHAASFTWSGAADTNWNTTSSNWTGGGSTWANATGDQATFTTTGAGAVTVVSGINANLITFSNSGYTLSGATLTLSGTTPGIVATADATISNVLAGSAGLNKTGAGALTLSGVNTYTGTTLVNAGVVNLGGGYTGGGALNVASLASTRGVVNVTSGTYAFSTGTIGTGTSSAGAVTQSGGTLGFSAANTYFTVGNGSYGSYVFSNGTVNATGGSGLRVGYGSTGSFLQTGGSLNLSRYFSIGGLNSSGLGVATLVGGTSNVASGYWMIVGDSTSGGNGTLNLGTQGNGTATFTSTNTTGILVGGASGTSGRANLNSGTLILNGPINKAAASVSGTLNLNGGTLQPGANSTTLIASGMTATTVYNGGLNVNTNGLSAVVAASLTPATGNGIYIGTTLPIATGGGAGYMGAPLVTVSGGTGTGAMAIANVTGGVVTGVTLTNPGQGYTAGDNITFAFASGGFTTAATSYVYTLLPSDVAANNTGGLTKTGNGTLSITGANTYTGNTTITTGTLQIGNGGNTGSISGPIVNNANLTINRSDDLTFNQNVSGNGSITKAGTNKLTLDYSASNTSKLPDGGTLTLAGGTLNLTGGSHTEVVSGTNIAGTVSLTRTGGTATIALGTITLTSGQLDIGGTGIATTTSPNVNGILPGVTILGQQAANDGNGNIIVFSSFTDIEREGSFIDSDGSQNIRIIDGGFGGSITLSTPGTTDINSLSVAATGGLSTVEIGTGNMLLLSASGSIKTPAGTGGLSFIGGMLSAGGIADSPGLIVFENASVNPITVDSEIVDNGLGAVTLSKIGNGTLIVNGTNNYSGATTVSAGILKITKSSGLGTTAAGTTISSGAALELEGNLTIGAETLALAGTGVSGNGVLRNISGTTTLAGVVTLSGSAVQLQADTGSLTLSQPLAVSTGVTLTKTGAGTISMLGAGTGTLPSAIVVSAGKLIIGSSGGGFGVDKMSGSGSVTVASGATLELTSPHSLGGSDSGMTESVTINGGTLTLSQEQYFNSLTLNGATINGPDDLRPSSTNNIFVTGSTPTIISTPVEFVGSNTGNFNVADVTANSAADLTLSGLIYDIGNMTKTGAGTLLITGTNTYSGTTTITAGTIQLGNGGATGKFGAGNVVNNAALVINRDTTSDLVIPGILSGSGSLTQIGGKTILSGNNTYTGVTTISGGSVQIGNGGLTGSFGTNSVTNNGAVIFNRDTTTDLTVANAISGTGSVTQSGSGRTFLTGTNSYTGNTTVNNGTLSLSSGFLADTSTVSISSGATLNLSHNATDVVDKLFIGGVLMVPGTWGGQGSTADHKDDRITGTGILSVTTGASASAFDVWASSKPGLSAAGAAKADNPDKDGMNNFGEFAFDGDPLSGKADKKIVTKIATIGSDKVLTLTIPVRNFSLPLAFTGSTSKTVTVDGVIYVVQGSVGLVSFDQVVTEVTGTDATAIQADLPSLSNGWSYHTFRAAGVISPGVPQSFLRARVSDQ